MAPPRAAGRPGHRVENRERCREPTPVTVRRTPELLERLALAIAGGQTVRAWARAQVPEVPRRTAYSWSRRPEVIDLVRRIRRRAIDRAIGHLTRSATKAARKLAELIDDPSHPLQLQAARAVLADLMAVADHHDFEDRLAALERRAAAATEPAPAHDPGAPA